MRPDPRGAARSAPAINRARQHVRPLASAIRTPDEEELIFITKILFQEAFVLTRCKRHSGRGIVCLADLPDRSLLRAGLSNDECRQQQNGERPCKKAKHGSRSIFVCERRTDCCHNVHTNFSSQSIDGAKKYSEVRLFDGNCAFLKQIVGYAPSGFCIYIPVAHCPATNDGKIKAKTI
jgi:hypothetical protein